MRSAALVALIALVVAGCAGDESGEDVRVADAYADAVQVVVDVAPTSEVTEVSEAEDLVVWVHPLQDGASIDLEVQVEMLEMLEDWADVRFADSFDETLHDAEDDPSVIDDGVSVGLGVYEPPEAEIMATLFVTGDRRPSELLVVRRGGRWQLDGDSGA